MAMANWRRGYIEPWFIDLASRDTLITNVNAENGQEQLQKTRREILRLYHPDKLSGYDIDDKEKHEFGRDVMDQTEAFIKDVVSRNGYLH